MNRTSFLPLNLKPPYCFKENEKVGISWRGCLILKHALRAFKKSKTLRMQVHCRIYIALILFLIGWHHWYPVLDFLWRLPSVLSWGGSLAGMLPHLQWIPQIHLWFDTCWPLPEYGNKFVNWSKSWWNKRQWFHEENKENVPSKHELLSKKHAENIAQAIIRK